MGNALKRGEIDFALLQENEGESRVWKRRAPLSLGVLYEYQKKRVGRRGFCKSMKEKNLEMRESTRKFEMELDYTR